MEWIKYQKGTKFIGIFLLFFLPLALVSAQIKVKVIVDDASVKVSPDIGGNTLARVALNTVLEAEEKQGLWYKVYMQKEGVRISGYIHEIYVEEVGEGNLTERTGEVKAVAEIPQAEIMAGITIKLEENKNLIRQDKDFIKAIDSLRPLIATLFRITDNKKQKEMAAQIFLWIGLAFAGKGDSYAALTEFKNMFEVDHEYSKEITRNIFDPEVVGLIQHAEKEFLGLVTEYSLEVSTEPKEATLKIDGKEIGSTPEMYRTSIPQLVLEIEKNGYKSVKEEIFLTQASTKKEYTLERLGRKVELRSEPAGAKVYLDGEDTGQVTNCQLPFVTFGRHKFSLNKENYAGWEDWIEINEGDEPAAIEVILTASNYEYLGEWGGPESKTFSQPTAITVDKENNVYVVDESDMKVKKFNPEGRLLSSWGNAGKEFKNIKTPAGICVDNQGFIYVTDVKNHSIMKYNNNGQFVAKWGKEGDKDIEFNGPLGIAVDGNNDIYVADSGNHRLKKFSSNGVLKTVWGKQGSTDGSFVFPSAIALNQKGEVFVLDRARLQKFTAEGEFIATWGKSGVADGEFNRAMGMFIDKDNYVYVSDSTNNRIQKFDENGKFIAKWGTRGTAEGQMSFPYGIAIDGNGFVFVAEKYNNRVQKFGVKSQEEQ